MSASGGENAEPHSIPLPRSASSLGSSLNAGGLSRNNSGNSRSLKTTGAPSTAVTGGHSPLSQTTTFGHRITGEGSISSQSAHQSAISSNHIPGIQPSAAFFHPSRPTYYSSNNFALSNLNHAVNPSSTYPVLPAHMMPAPSAPTSSTVDQRPSSTGSDSFAHGSFTTDEFGNGKGTLNSNSNTVARSFSTKISREPLLPIGQRPKPPQAVPPHAVTGRARSNTTQHPRKSNGNASGSTTPGGRVRTSLEKFLRRTLSVDAHSPSSTFSRSVKEIANLEDLEQGDNYLELKNQRAIEEEATFNITNDKAVDQESSISRRRRSPQPYSPSSEHHRNRFPQFNPNPPEDASKPPLDKTPILSESGVQMRNYELHPSNNGFFFGGKILTGGDSALPFIASFLVALGIAGTWSGTTAVWWWHNESPAVSIIGAYLCLLTFSNMLATAFSDPGILPRDLDPDPPYPSSSSSDDGSRAPLPRELKVRNITVRVKYCQTCRIYRPPRSSHCRMCDNCVDGCDHHCQWVNNCVGRRNYTFFIIYLTSAILTLILVICTSALHLVIQAHRDNISATASIRKGAGSAVVFVMSSIVIWPVGGLLGYHIRLLVLNLTTIEQIRNTAHKSLTNGPPPPNPFALGNWRRNLAEMLCRPRGNSWLDASAPATEDKRGPNPGADWEGDTTTAASKG
ncbi:hypothetical protein SCHPADRAFT_819513 [Schizopora paradoxa]|uniref:Palmitoyltransferase n=1 Tax=Schizopora paradoxa TaxID=27342 RepID=A0A0H2SNA3_9AGAM|nr:hypothetical protein SCHPADRAFT_819513 [Schizopora paradoxa]